MSKRIKLLLLSLSCFIPLQFYFIMVWLPKFLSFSGGIPNLDSRFNYSVSDVSILLNSLGEAGIQHYFSGTIIDLFYALLMGLTVFALFKVILGKEINNNFYKIISIIIPIAYLCFDWIENIGILIFLNNFPLLNGNYVTVFSFFTMLKQFMAIIAGCYLIFIIIIRIIAQIKKIKK